MCGVIQPSAAGKYIFVHRYNPFVCVEEMQLKYYGQKYASTDVQKQFLSSPLEVSETLNCYNISSGYVRACGGQMINSCYKFSLVYLMHALCVHLPASSRSYLVHLCMDFKMIWHSWCP